MTCQIKKSIRQLKKKIQMLLNLNMNQKNQTQINFHKYQFFNLFFFARPKHSNQSHKTQLNNSNWTQLRKKKRSQIQSLKKKIHVGYVRDELTIKSKGRKKFQILRWKEMARGKHN